jgi:N-acetylglucosamine-6-phosphate deacetylase
MEALCGGRIFDGDNILEGSAVVLSDGKIRTVVREDDIPSGTRKVDLAGRLLAPGFIDIQVNGGGGVLLNDEPNAAGIAAIAGTHRGLGTTGLLPTLISDDWEVMAAAADGFRRALADGEAGVLGIHFEGPWLNTQRKGAHDASKLRPPDEKTLDLYCANDLGKVVVTLAPEMVPPGTVARLAGAGVRVCAGHSAATDEEISASLKEGLAGFTHLFNAMSPMEGRAPGIVGAALDDEESWCGIIVDGHHVHPAALRTAIAAKKTGRMILVSDAMPSVGTTADSFPLGGRTVRVDNGRCVTEDGTLVGSNLHMAMAVRNTVEQLGLPIEEALRMASLYPAAFLQLNRERGRIAEGYRADLVLLDAHFQAQRVWINGNLLDQ